MRYIIFDNIETFVKTTYNECQLMWTADLELYNQVMEFRQKKTPNEVEESENHTDNPNTLVYVPDPNLYPTLNTICVFVEGKKPKIIKPFCSWYEIKAGALDK